MKEIKETKVFFAISDDLNKGFIQPLLKEPDINKEFLQEYVAITQLNKATILVTRKDSGKFVATDIEYDYDEIRGFNFYYCYEKSHEAKYIENKLNDEKTTKDAYRDLVNSEISLLENEFLLSQEDIIAVYRIKQQMFDALRKCHENTSFQRLYDLIVEQLNKPRKK